MKSFSSLLVATMALVVFAGIAAASTTRGIDAREMNQRMRIREGVRSGELTPREAMRLRRGEAHIRRMEWRDRRYGVTQRERIEMNRALERESRRIWRLKHNGRERSI